MGGVKRITGKTAPDGSTGAAEFSNGGAIVAELGTTPVAGETWVGGMWVRSVTGNGFAGGTAIKFQLNGIGYPATGDYCIGGTGGTQGVSSSSYMVGDGQWFWVSAKCKVWTGRSSTVVVFSFNGDATHTIQVYGPVLYRIPPNTLSDNEIADLARSMSSFSNGAQTADIAAMPGQKLTVPSGTYSNPNLGVFTHSNTARRTYTLPDTTGTVPIVIYGKQSSATNSNIAPVTMVSSTTTEHAYALGWTVSLVSAGSGCSGNTTVEIDVIFTDPNAYLTTTQNLGVVTIASRGNGTVGFVASGMDHITAKTGTAVLYQTRNYTAGSGCTTDPTYQITPSLVQLW